MLDTARAMSKENVEAVRQTRVAFNSGDPDLVAALLARDAEIVPMRAAFEGTSYRGPDAAQRFFADLNETWQEIKMEELETRDLGDRVFATGLVRGRGQRSGIQVVVEMKMAWVVDFQGGLITRFVTYTGDRAEALEAAGLAE